MLSRMMAPSTPVVPVDERVTDAILTPQGLAALENMSATTAYSWWRHGLVTRQPSRRGWPSIPLLGLVEGHVAWQLRQQHLPTEDVRAVINLIRHSGASEFAALSRRLVTDGVYAYLKDHDGLGRIVDQQLTMEVVVEQFLTQLLTDDDGFVYRYVVAQLPGVVIDPEFNAGRMMFEDRSIPVFAVMGMLDSGETPEVVADEFKLDPSLVTAVHNTDPSWLSLIA